MWANSPFSAPPRSGTFSSPRASLDKELSTTLEVQWVFFSAGLDIVDSCGPDTRARAGGDPTAEGREERSQQRRVRESGTVSGRSAANFVPCAAGTWAPSRRSLPGTRIKPSPPHRRLFTVATQVSFYTTNPRFNPPSSMSPYICPVSLRSPDSLSLSLSSEVTLNGGSFFSSTSQRLLGLSSVCEEQLSSPAAVSSSVSR